LGGNKKRKQINIVRTSARREKSLRTPIGGPEELKEMRKKKGLEGMKNTAPLKRRQRDWLGGRPRVTTTRREIPGNKGIGKKNRNLPRKKRKGRFEKKGGEQSEDIGFFRPGPRSRSVDHESM